MHLLLMMVPVVYLSCGKCDVHFIYLVLQHFPFGGEMLANDLKSVATQGLIILLKTY